MRKPRNQLSGGAKLAAAGKRAVLLGVPPEVHAQLQLAADYEMRPLSQFILYWSFCAALEILDKEGHLEIDAAEEKRLTTLLAGKGKSFRKGGRHV